MTFLRSLKVLAFALVALAAVGAAEMSQAVAESFLDAEESRLTELVNEHRASHGAQPLTTNEALRMVARRQTQRMAMAGYIYHNPDLKKEAREAIPGFTLAAENVARTSEGGTVEFVHEGLLQSEGHHRNIDYGDFNIVGIGAAPASDGMKYYTQNFAEWHQGSTAPAPARPAAPAATSPPVLTVKRRAAPAPRAAAPTPAPTASPTPTPVPVVESTPLPTVAPPSPAGAASPGDRHESGVTLAGGLTGMLVRFFAKLAFWR